MNYSHAQKFTVKKTPINNNNHTTTLNKNMVVDDYGFLWYSTYNGLVRDMGTTSVFYPYNPKSEISVQYTYDLVKTFDNKIIATTNRGLFVLNIDNNETEFIEATYPKTSNLVVFTSMVRDVNGTIWIGTDKNYIYSFSTKNELKPYVIDNGFYKDLNAESPSFRMNMQYAENNFVVFEQNDQWYYLKNETIKHLFGSNEVFGDNKASRLFVLKSEQYFKKGESGEIAYKNLKLPFKYVPEIDCHLFRMPKNTKVEVINKNNLFNFVYPINFLFYNQDNLETVTLQSQNNNYKFKVDDSFLFNKSIMDVFADSRGYILAMTSEGVNKVYYSTNGFSNDLTDYRAFGFSVNISCREFFEDSKGNMYLYTYKGLFHKKAGEDKFKPLDINLSDEVERYVRGASFNIHLLNDDEILVFGHYGFIFRINLKTGDAIKVPLAVDKVPNYLTIYDGVKLTDDQMLIASSLGLLDFNPQTNTLVKASKLNPEYNIDNYRIVDVLLTKNKKDLWIATSENGVLRKDLLKNTVAHYTTSSKDLKLVHNDISTLYEDDESNIWIGTFNGLQKVNPNTLQSKIFTTLDGLNNDNIASIQEDNESVWAATFGGLVKINKTNYNIESYFSDDGLSDNEFNLKSSFKDSKGNLYFGTVSGLVTINPNKTLATVSNKDLFLVEYQMYNDETKQDATFLKKNNDDNTFNISYLNNYLTLKFAVNDLFNSEKTDFQYRLTPLSDKWVSLKNYSTIQLRGLEPNDYKLDVKAFSSNGKPTNVLSYNIKVNQVFYKKVWFIALSALLISGLVFLFTRYRRKKLQQDYEQKGKIYQLESKALRAQMNPHFIFNTLNGMQSVMLLKGEREANRYFGTFSKLIRQTLDMSNSEYISLLDEIKYLNLYLTLESLRLNNKLITSFNIDPKLSITSQAIPCMLVQPIVENSIIHGLSPKKSDDMQIAISFNLKENDILKVEVTDNGVGRQAAEEIQKRSRKNHKSWATHIMNERIHISNSINNKKIKFDIEDLFEDQKPAGTKVVLEIPLTYLEEHALQETI